MLSPGLALEAVIADTRDHPITPDGTGLYTVTRHIELLCQLAARTAAETEYQLAPSSAGLPSAKVLALGTGHLGKAIAHYTQTLIPLLYLPAAKEETEQQRWLVAEHRGALQIHLNGARTALADAHAVLSPPQAPAPVVPAASAPAPPHTPGPRGRS
ncbi:hypothetical protein LRE75_33515 [Streptomyces sp. 372A]